MASRLLRLFRAVWLGLNGATLACIVALALAPPVEGTHPGFLFGPILFVLLFPGSLVVMLAIGALGTTWWASASVWLTGGILLAGYVVAFAIAYAFWFDLVPRALSSAVRKIGLRPGSTSGGAPMNQ